jgi:ketosteroid isomerase-like protein
MKPKGTNFRARISIYLLLCVIVVFWGFQVFGEEWSAAQKEVWKMQQTLWELWKKGDMEERLKLYQENSVLWTFYGSFPSGKDMLNRKFIIILSFDLKPLEIKIFDNVAIVQYRCDWATPGDNYSTRFTDIWMNQDGKWKIIGSMSADCSKLPPCL